MTPINVTLQSRHVLDSVESEIAVDSLSSHISSTATQSLIKTWTGEHLLWNQIHYLKGKEKQQMLSMNKNSNQEKMSSADKLIKYTNALEQLKHLVVADSEWNSGPIILTIATSITDDSPFKLTLTKTLGQKSYAPAVWYWDDSTYYWFSSTLDQNTKSFRHERIHPMFIRSCWDAVTAVFGHYKHVQNTL